MNIAETHDLLTFIAAYDNRRFDDATVYAWAPIFADVPYVDARTAVTRHFATSDAYLMPVHVRRIAEDIDRERRKAAREAREAVQAADVRALPSRFEDDVTRTVRVQAGVSHARDLMAALTESIAKAKAARDADPRLAGFPTAEDGAA